MTHSVRGPDRRVAIVRSVLRGVGKLLSGPDRSRVRGNLPAMSEWYIGMLRSAAIACVPAANAPRPAVDSIE